MDQAKKIFGLTSPYEAELCPAGGSDQAAVVAEGAVQALQQIGEARVRRATGVAVPVPVDGRVRQLRGVQGRRLVGDVEREVQGGENRDAVARFHLARIAD